MLVGMDNDLGISLFKESVAKYQMDLFDAVVRLLMNRIHLFIG